MNHSTPRGNVVRSRATRRLRNLTIGTAFAGMAASTGFAGLAAATYDGTGATPADAAAPSSTTSGVTVTGPSATSNPTSSSGSSPTSPPSSTSSSGVSRSSLRPHVSTGGS
jgi:hypothetical protein